MSQRRRNPRRKFIQIVFCVALVGSFSVVRSQPVVIPDQTHDLFDSTDFDPIQQAADAQQNQAGWEARAGLDLDALEAAWEADVLAAIDAEVLSNTSADFYNSNPEYAHYIRSRLEIQAAEQKSDWLHAAQITQDPARQEFLVALSEDIRREIEEDRKAALREYDGQLDPGPSHSRSYSEWRKEFQVDYENGLVQFQTARIALDQEMTDYDAELAATDAAFQQNLQQIDAAEDLVRTGIQDSINDLSNSLATSEFYYEETCAGAVCSVDTGTLNQAGVDLQNLINSLQNGLNNDTPLSVLSQQMTDYLEAQEQAALNRKAYWDTQSYGTINYDVSLGAQGAPQMGYNTEFQHVSAALHDPAELSARASAQHAMKTTRTADWIRDNRPEIQGVIDHSGGDSTLLAETLINYTGSNTDTREIETIASADVEAFAWSYYPNGHVWHHSGYFTNSGVAPGTGFTHQNPTFWIPVNHLDDPDVSVIKGPGSRFQTLHGGYTNYSTHGMSAFLQPIEIEVQWKRKTGVDAMGDPVYSATETAYYTVYNEVLNMRVMADATWKDNTAIANAARWQGYADDLSANLSHWRDNIMPAITAWESQAADYRTAYSDWQVQAALDRQQVLDQYSDALLDLEASRGKWLGRVQEEERLGVRDWLVREAAVNDSDDSSRQPRTTASAAVREHERVALNALLDRFQPTPTQVDPSRGTPDFSLLGGVQDAFSSSLLGAGQVSLISAINDRGVERRNAITETLAMKAVNQGYEVKVEKNGTVTGVRQIASGRAIRRAGSRGTSQNDYEMELMEQAIQLTGADAIRLADTGSLFSQWDRASIESETRDIFKDYEDRLETKIQAEEANVANKEKQKKDRYDAFKEDMDRQIADAVRQEKKKKGLFSSFVNSIMSSMMGGMDFRAATTSFVQGQVTNIAYEALGWPQEIISGMVSGMDFHSSAKSFVKTKTTTLIAEKAAKDSSGAIPAGVLNGILSGQTIENSIQAYAEEKAYEEIDKKVPGLSALLRGMKAKEAKKKAQQKQMQDTVVTVAAVASAPATGGASMYALAAYKSYEAGRTTGDARSAAVAGAAGLVTAYTAGAVNMNATWDPENGLEGGVGFGPGGGVNVGVNYSKEGGYGGDVGLQVGELGSVGVSYNQQQGAGVRASLSGVGDDLSGMGLDLSYTQNGGFSGGVSFSPNESNATGSLTYSDAEGVGVNLSYTRGVAENTSMTGSLAWTRNSGTSANVSANYTGPRERSAAGPDFAPGRPEGFHNRVSGFGGGLGWSQAGGWNSHVSVGGVNAFNYDEVNGWTGNANFETSYFERERISQIKEYQRQNRQDAAYELARAEKERMGEAEEKLRELGVSEEEIAALEGDPKKLKDYLTREGNETLALVLDGEGIVELGTSRGEGYFDRNLGGIVDNVVNSFGGVSSADLLKTEDGKFKIRTCFVAGTLVRTKQGSKPIEEIKVGDWVWGYDEKTKQTGLYPVSQVFVRKAQAIHWIHLSNGEKIGTTWSHKFYIVGKGWVSAEDIAIGDFIHTEESLWEAENHAAIEVVAHEVEKGESIVFNFSVKTAHTYFVGGPQEWALVHNSEYGNSTLWAVDSFYACSGNVDCEIETISKIDQRFRRNEITAEEKKKMIRAVQKANREWDRRGNASNQINARLKKDAEQRIAEGGPKTGWDRYKGTIMEGLSGLIPSFSFSFGRNLPDDFFDENPPLNTKSIRVSGGDYIALDNPLPTTKKAVLGQKAISSGELDIEKLKKNLEKQVADAGGDLREGSHVVVIRKDPTSQQKNTGRVPYDDYLVTVVDGEIRAITRGSGDPGHAGYDRIKEGFHSEVYTPVANYRGARNRPGGVLRLNQAVPMEGGGSDQTVQTHEGNTSSFVKGQSQGCVVNELSGVVVVTPGLIGHNANVVDFQDDYSRKAKALQETPRNEPKRIGAQTYFMNSFAGKEKVSLTIVNKDKIGEQYGALEKTLGNKASEKRKESYAN